MSIQQPTPPLIYGSETYSSLEVVTNCNSLQYLSENIHIDNLQTNLLQSNNIIIDTQIHNLQNPIYPHEASNLNYLLNKVITLSFPNNKIIFNNSGNFYATNNLYFENNILYTTNILTENIYSYKFTINNNVTLSVSDNISSNYNLYLPFNIGINKQIIGLFNNELTYFNINQASGILGSIQLKNNNDFTFNNNLYFTNNILNSDNININTLYNSLLVTTSLELISNTYTLNLLFDTPTTNYKFIFTNINISTQPHILSLYNNEFIYYTNTQIISTITNTLLYNYNLNITPLTNTLIYNNTININSKINNIFNLNEYVNISTQSTFLLIYKDVIYSLYNNTIVMYDLELNNINTLNLSIYPLKFLIYKNNIIFTITSDTFYVLSNSNIISYINITSPTLMYLYNNYLYIIGNIISIIDISNIYQLTIIDTISIVYPATNAIIFNNFLYLSTTNLIFSIIIYDLNTKNIYKYIELQGINNFIFYNNYIYAIGSKFYVLTPELTIKHIVNLDSLLTINISNNLAYITNSNYLYILNIENTPIIIKTIALSNITQSIIYGPYYYYINNTSLYKYNIGNILTNCSIGNILTDNLTILGNTKIGSYINSNNDIYSNNIYLQNIILEHINITSSSNINLLNNKNFKLKFNIYLETHSSTEYTIFSKHIYPNVSIITDCIWNSPSGIPKIAIKNIINGECKIVIYNCSNDICNDIIEISGIIY